MDGRRTAPRIYLPLVKRKKSKFIRQAALAMVRLPHNENFLHDTVKASLAAYDACVKSSFCGSLIF